MLSVACDRKINISFLVEASDMLSFWGGKQGNRDTENGPAVGAWNMRDVGERRLRNERRRPRMGIFECDGGHSMLPEADIR